MCVPNGPLFQRCQVYDWPSFFDKKCMNDPIFLDSYVKGPFFWHPGMCTYFSLRDFSRLLVFLVFNELSVHVFVYKPAINGYKNQSQYTNRSSFWMSKYMNGSVFFKGNVYEWGRFWNTCSHTRTKITPVTPPRPHPPPPPTSRPPRSEFRLWQGNTGKINK